MVKRPFSFGRTPKGRKTPTKSKETRGRKSKYKSRFVVDKIPDSGRRRKLRTFNDRQKAINYVARQKYRNPDAKFPIREEKIPRLWQS